MSGVPQGSILGPLLFLIYIDDVTYGPFSPGTRIVLYADDILLYRTILSNSDYSYLQSDANTVQDWVNCNHMSLNPSKCKFMLISRKRNRINNPPMITINGQILESVPTFKYLGLLLTSDLSWSKHIEGACTKAKKILGLLYRRFYQHADQDTLRQLYISIVRPHMEYAAPVWDPHLRKDQDLLESTQKFACKMITRKWDKGYDELLNMTNLPSLADRRLYLKLCSLYKIVHNLSYFPPNIIVPKVTRSYTSTPFTLYQPFAHTNCFLNSFVPHCVSHWNSLPESVVSSPSLATFKHSLKQYYMH